MTNEKADNTLKIFDSTKLDEFLSAPARPPGTLRLCGVRGFMFAVASSPVPVPVAAWLPQVFAEGAPGYSSEMEARDVEGMLASLYQEIEAQVLSKSAEWPSACAPLAKVTDNFASAAPLHQWADGFMIGHSWLEEAWEDLPEEVDADVGTAVMVLGFFAHRDLAKAYHKEFGNKGQSLEAMGQQVIDSLDEALQNYSDIGLILRTGE